MTRKTQRIVYGLFVLGICIAFSAAMAIGTGMFQEEQTKQCNNVKESRCGCSCNQNKTGNE
jgi:hypothetical protein